MWTSRCSKLIGVALALVFLRLSVCVSQWSQASNNQCTFDNRKVTERGREDVKTTNTNLVLSYASGSLDLDLFNVFLRSLRATGSDADVVVLIHQLDPSPTVKLLAQTYGAQLIDVNSSLVTSVAWSSNAVLFRFRVWSDFLTKHHDKYCYILNSDLDVYFQTDPFICFFGSSCDTTLSALHAFSENPAMRIGDCSVHSNWYVRDCVALDGEKKFAEQRHRERICAGFTIGTVQAHLVYLKTMSDLISDGEGKCNDQAIHNMIFWGDSMPQIRDVYIWDYFRGPVKTLDVGYIQDEFGRITNELGAPYCVIHQFKEERNPKFFKRLRKLFPLHNDSRRVHLEDTRFEACNRTECLGEKVHPSVMMMIAQNITGAWRGTMPTLLRHPHDLGPLLSQTGTPTYEYITGYRH